MAMAWNGQVTAHALQPVHRSGSCSTANFFQCTTSRLKRCGSHMATHRPQPVQRWVSMSGSRCDLRGACDSWRRRTVSSRPANLSSFMAWIEPVRTMGDSEKVQPRPTLAVLPRPLHRWRPSGRRRAGRCAGRCDRTSVYTVGRCSNASKLPSSATTSTALTTDDLGPCRAHATSWSTAPGGPATMASTDPSRRFRTQPPRPNRRACSTMDHR